MLSNLAGNGRPPYISAPAPRPGESGNPYFPQTLARGDQILRDSPTLRQQVETFHRIMHAFSMAAAGGDNSHVKRIVTAMDDWSYAHRVGNGALTEREQADAVCRAFWKLDQVSRAPLGDPRTEGEAA
jgi:hypothetical protein